jgi:5-formyltetrahydrofolate cyclo-ligase
MRSELDPRPLLKNIRAAGGRIVLPAIVEGKIVFRLHELGDALVPGTFGTSEPRGDARALDPDILLVPLAAFDLNGGRIGYGKGYYDEAIARLRQKRRIGVVGLAFETQQVEEVPLTPRDQKLDLVLTEAGVRWISTYEHEMKK